MNDSFILDELLADAGAEVTIRLGRPEDASGVERLAELDERDPGAAPHLVADEGGEIVAALSLTDGTTVGDPFRLTLPTIGLLRARAAQLGAPRPARRKTRGLRRLAASLTALAAATTLAGGALAAGSTVAVAGKPVAIKAATKAFAIEVSCLAPDTPCSGVLDVRTASKIKPYAGSPAQVHAVGTFPFTIPAGGKALVKGRVYGPALAEAMLRGRVRLSITPRALEGQLGPARTVVFSYPRR